MAFPRRTLEGLAKTIADLKQMIQNVAIPQGTIWWFHGRTTAPVGWAICNGSNGTPNLIGRYPLGATSGIGSTVAAGLPNITGTIGPVIEEGALGRYTNGAFYESGKGTGHAGGVDYIVKMNASRCSSIYGNSSTVTPPSVKLLPCMKL